MSSGSQFDITITASAQGVQKAAEGMELLAQAQQKVGATAGALAGELAVAAEGIRGTAAACAYASQGVSLFANKIVVAQSAVTLFKTGMGALRDVAAEVGATAQRIGRSVVDEGGHGTVSGKRKKNSEGGTQAVFQKNALGKTEGCGSATGLDHRHRQGCLGYSSHSHSSG